MASFAFNRLAVELQLMVWERARTSIGPQAITADLNLSTTTLCFRGQNVARVKDYIRLFSICHSSRQEVLRNPPVLILESPDCRRVDYPNPDYDAKPLTIKYWGFGRVFTDIAFDLCLLEWVPEPEGEREGTPEPQSCPDFVRKALVDLFGTTIRRLHVYGEDIWYPMSTTPRRRLPSTTVTFCDSGAIHFIVPGMGSRKLGEVARRDMSGVTSLNNTAVSLVLGDNFSLRGACHCTFDRRESLVNLVTGMGPYFPGLEYVSLLAWKYLAIDTHRTR